MKTTGWKKVQTVIRRHHGRNQNKGELVVRKLIIVLVLLSLCGCIPTARIVIVNKTNMDLSFRLDLDPDEWSEEECFNYRKRHNDIFIPKNSNIEGLCPQRMNFVVLLMSENQDEKKYKLQIKKSWGFYTHMYIAILPDWTLAVYDSMSDLESPIDKTQYLILPFNSESDVQ